MIMDHKPFMIVMMAALVVSPALFAQSPEQSPDPSQAPFILSSLDTDNDGKISKSEAADDMKQNFEFIDSNRDGGIDLEELKEILKMAAAQNGSGGSNQVNSPAAAPTNAGAEGSTMIEINAMSPTPEQMEAFLAMEHDGPIVMLNLLKFKPGGAAEYAKYGVEVQKIFKKIGARIIFSGRPTVALIGNADWDAVALAEYPNKMALINMIQSPEYQAIHHHRENGLAGQVNYAVIQNNPSN